MGVWCYFIDTDLRLIDDVYMPSPNAKAIAPTVDEVLVTRGMLMGVRTELLERIDQGREETRASIQRLDARIDAVRAELKGEIQELKGEIHELKAEVHQIKAGMARIEVLVEEQNARNKIVLDGIAALLSRQNQVEERVTQVEVTIRKLATAPSAG